MRSGWGLRTVAVLLAAGAALVAVAPLFVVMGDSLSLHRGPSLAPYRFLLADRFVLRAALVSVQVTVAGTALSLAVTTLGAWGLSRRRLPAVRLLRAIAFVPLLVNGGLIPFYVTVLRLGLIDTFGALVLPFALSLVNLHIMIRYFASDEISACEEAAWIDGAGPWRTLVQVILPLSTPAVATIGMLYAIGAWNSWFPAFIFVNTRSLYPLQMIVRELTIGSGNLYETGMSLRRSGLAPTEPLKMAAVAIAVVPVLPAVLAAQRWIRRGAVLSGLM